MYRTVDSRILKIHNFNYFIHNNFVGLCLGLSSERIWQHCIYFSVFFFWIHHDFGFWGVCVFDYFFAVNFGTLDFDCSFFLFIRHFFGGFVSLIKFAVKTVDSRIYILRVCVFDKYRRNCQFSNSKKPTNLTV